MLTRQQALVDVQDGQSLVFQVARRLLSPNTWQGCHWRQKHRETTAWEKALRGALSLSSDARAVWTQLAAVQQLPRARWERRRVFVTRMIPSGRFFIKDEDNLRFSTKPLNDALKRLGLICQDSHAWLEQPTPTQMVSPDGMDWTLITVGPAQGSEQ